MWCSRGSVNCVVLLLWSTKYILPETVLLTSQPGGKGPSSSQFTLLRSLRRKANKMLRHLGNEDETNLHSGERGEWIWSPVILGCGSLSKARIAILMLPFYSPQSKPCNSLRMHRTWIERLISKTPSGFERLWKARQLKSNFNAQHHHIGDDRAVKGGRDIFS